MPPLGISYIASVLRANSYKNVNIIDMEVCRMSFSDLEEHLLNVSERKRYDVVGISALTPTMNNVKGCADVIKRVFPECVLVVGGAHPTLEPEDTFERLPKVDFIFRGEAEYAFLKFINLLDSNKRNFESVDGLCYKRNGGYHISDRIVCIENLDILPFPAYDLLPMNHYFDAITPSEKCSMLMTTRGCSYRCTFCEEPLLYGRKVRARSPKNIVDEIELLKNKYGIDFIIFHDSTFNYDEERVEAVCDEMIRREVNISWRVKARVDHVNKRMLWKMKRAGCKLIQYGAENANQRFLKLMRKGITVEQVRRAVRLTKEIGIDVLLFFIVGYPGETKRDIEKTINYAIELDPTYVEFCIATPMPKSEMTELVKENIISGNLGDYYQWNPVISYDNLTSKELLKLYHKAYLNFYMRKDYILKMLTEVRGKSSLKMTIKGFLGLVTYSGPFKLFSRTRAKFRSE